MAAGNGPIRLNRSARLVVPVELRMPTSQKILKSHFYVFKYIDSSIFSYAIFDGIKSCLAK